MTDVFYERLKDDEYIDEIKVRIVERFKTSELSGDEWRFSTFISFYRKGQLLYERRVHKIEDAAAWLPWGLKTAGEQEEWKNAEDANLCFQPGCPETAVSEYELKEKFDRTGNKLDPSDVHFKYRRKFCKKHLERGDASREDSDSNYIVISGLGPDAADMSEANVVEAARVNVNADSIEDIPRAVEEVRKQFGH